MRARSRGPLPFKMFLLPMSLLPSDSPAVEALVRACERVLGSGFACSAVHVLGRLDGSVTGDETALIRPVVLIRNRKISFSLTLAWLGCAGREQNGGDGEA